MTEIRTILAGKVGTYTFNDGTTSDAIALLPDATFGYNYPPSDVGKNGVECVVVEPELFVEERLSESAALSARWTIYLKQWDTTIDMVETAEALVLGLSIRNYRIGNWNTTIAAEELGIIRTMSLDILDEYILAEDKNPLP